MIRLEDKMRKHTILLLLILCILILCSCTNASKMEEYTAYYDDGKYEIRYIESTKSRNAYIIHFKGQCPETFYIPDTTPRGARVIGIKGNASISGALKKTKKLYLSDTLKYLGDVTLQGTAPEYLYVGDSVQEISAECFDYIDANLSVIETHNNPYYTTPLSQCLVEEESKTLLIGTNSGFIPEYIKILGRHAFYGSRISDIKIPDGVTTIEHCAFNNTSNLNSDLVLPDSVMEIGEYAFGHSSITGLRGGSYTVIPSHMLSHCLSLTDFQIPDTVKEIESFFIDTIVCGENIPPKLSLKELFIPASVEIIHKYAMPENITIYCEAEEQPEGWEENWANESNTIYWGQKRKDNM